jgi:hypothetical protein
MQSGLVLNDKNNLGYNCKWYMVLVTIDPPTINQDISFHFSITQMVQLPYYTNDLVVKTCDLNIYIQCPSMFFKK